MAGKNKKKNKSRKSNKIGSVGSTRALGSENQVNNGDVPLIPKNWQPAILALQVYRIRRTLDANDAKQTAGAFAGFSSSFQLSDLDAYTEFTNLFDQYRIHMIRMRFRPRFNFAAVVSTTDIMPRLYTVIDYNDANPITGVAQLRQYQTLKETNFDADHVRCFKPKVAVAAYSAAFTSYMSVTGGWIDTGSPAVQHYGLKGLVEAGHAGQVNLQVWSIETEYFLEFRQVI